MKKMVSAMLAGILILSLAGCGLGKKVEEKVEDEAAEAIVEGIFNENGVDVDIDVDDDDDGDGDIMTIQGEDGQEIVISERWPDSELAQSIPKFEKGRIDGVVESPESIMISLFEVEQEDAAAYIEECKPDFPLNNTEMSAEGMISWGGENDAGLWLALTHQDDAFSITLVKRTE